jgi:hypothetical protein
MVAVPSSNLLKSAFNLIRPQWIEYQRFLSRQTNEFGVDVSVYERFMSIQASVQSVPKSIYQNTGIEFQQTDVMIYLTETASEYVESGGFVCDGNDTMDGGKTWDGQVSPLPSSGMVFDGDDAFDSGATFDSTQMPDDGFTRMLMFGANADFVKGTRKLTRDVSGDRMQFAGILYQCLSASSWYAIDGWSSILCRKIGVADVRQ